MSILYADITSPTFSTFHNTLIKTAREHKISYRVRYRKSLSLSTKPLVISGYGVELALKRTDYIVIDDREKEVKPDQSATSATLEDKDVGADLKPLSKSELLRLGLRASSFVMQSKNPFEALLKLSQDFPKYSGAMAASNISEDFKKEHTRNRETLLQPGNNIVWMNGLQLVDRQIDAFTLLDLLRKERKLIAEVEAIGLSGAEAVKLLSHEKIAVSASNDGPLRYIWSDKSEGGNIILWLNDIENDRRYQGWPTALNAVSKSFSGEPRESLLMYIAASKNLSRAITNCTTGYSQSGYSCRFYIGSRRAACCESAPKFCREEASSQVWCRTNHQLKGFDGSNQNSLSSSVHIWSRSRPRIP